MRKELEFLCGKISQNLLRSPFHSEIADVHSRCKIGQFKAVKPKVSK